MYLITLVCSAKTQILLDFLQGCIKLPINEKQSTTGCFHMNSTTHTKVVTDFDETFTVCRAQNSKNNGRKNILKKPVLIEINPKYKNCKNCWKLEKRIFQKLLIFFVWLVFT